MHKVAVALIHHPVVDKNGKAITAAVTALDLHDIARAAKTFGVGAYYVVTPLEDQQILVRQIIDHWVTGYGARYNPDRQAALALIRMQPSLAAAVDEFEQTHGSRPCTVVTSARSAHSDLSCMGLRALILKGRPVLLLFGTAWGLAPEVLAQADYRLTPIQGVENYNHLAVRSAVSIILDRIADQREAQ
jgi:hypothetical protein